MSDKTNIEYLRDILEEIKGDCLNEEKMEEALEFLTAVENEFDEAAAIIQADQEEKKEEAEKNPYDGDTFNNDFVGLDTIEWRLEKGNLVIQNKMEQFITMLKKQNGAPL